MVGYSFYMALAMWLAAAPAALQYPASSPVEIGPAWSYFTTADPPERVLSYFADQWRSSGVPVLVDRHPDGSAVVSAFFTRESRQYAVVVMRSPSSGTLAFQLERTLEGALSLAVEGPRPVGFDDALARQLLPSHPDRAGPSNGSGLWPLGIEEASKQWAAILERGGYRKIESPAEMPNLPKKEERKQWVMRHRLGGREIWTQLVEVQPGLTAWVVLPMGGAAILEARAR